MRDKTDNCITNVRINNSSFDYAHYDDVARQLRSQFVFQWLFGRTSDDNFSRTSRRDDDTSRRTGTLATCN